MYLRIFTFICLCSLTLISNGNPAKNYIRQMQQPDGTTVTLTPMGDEYSHYFLTTDNQFVLKKDNAYYYAQVSPQGAIEPSGILAANPEELNAMQSDFVKNVNKEKLSEAIFNLRLEKTRYWIAKDDSDSGSEGKESRSSLDPWAGVGLASNRFPTSGNPKSMVILAEYQDVKFSKSDEETYDYFYRLLNENGFSSENGTGSVRDYYSENSNGVFNPEFVVYGPITLPENREYYGGNNSKGNDKHASQMIVDAVNILVEQGVDFSQFDTDNNKKVDNVYLYYAGIGEAMDPFDSPDAVWPHNSELRFMAAEISGINTVYGYKVGSVYVNNYACGSELTINSDFEFIFDGIGTFAHEFSHVLGLPDLYSTKNIVESTPRDFSILDTGAYLNDGRTPPAYSAFERNALGWIELTAINQEMTNVVIEDLKESNSAYVVPTDRDNEFYLFENRQKKGWDTYLPNSGMLIWHIDYLQSCWKNNTVNDDEEHQHVDLIEAYMPGDGQLDCIPFPGTQNITKFTPDTYPAFVSWSGEDCGVALTDIACTEEGKIQFNVSDPAGLESAIMEDNAVKIYYNTQGMIVVHPQSMQLYILKQGDKVSKIIYRQ